VTITPTVGEIGQATLTVTVSDGEAAVSRSFEFQVRSRLAFAVVDLGTLPGKSASFGTALNDDGVVVGYAAANAQSQQPRAFLYPGYGRELGLVDLRTGWGAASRALGINNAGRVVGAVWTGPNAFRGFLYDPESRTNLLDLGVFLGGTTSLASGINDDGLMTGFGDTASGQMRAFLANPALIDLGTLSNALGSQALAINNAGHVVGFAYWASGVTNAFLYANGQFVNLGTLPGGSNSCATALNDQGVIVGWADTAAGRVEGFVYAQSQMTSLGDVLGGGSCQPLAINTFGQIVGTALDTNGQRRAFVYDNGHALDLNALLPDNSSWTIFEARGINRYGQIVATAVRGDETRAVLLFPATEIGRRVPKPKNVVAALPEIELLSGQPGDIPLNSFHWSDYDGKLFAIRPVAARLRWRTTFAYTDTNRIESLTFNVWPKTPDIHVAYTPVWVEPNQTDFKYGFLNLAYTTINGANVDPSTKVFNAPVPGYSVLHFLRNEGQMLNPQLQSSAFNVVRTVQWDDSQHLRDHVPWEIGRPVTDARHNDWPGRNGYVFNQNAYYDGTGPDRAYDRAARAGPILPVNEDTADLRDDLIVVWYAKNRIGVAWSSYPTRYDLN
jgi:probable HAF family extracellular repeat protein